MTKIQGEERSTNSSPGRRGVFIGYELGPGATWTGMYKVLGIEDFAGKSLHPREPHTQFAHCCHPHLAKRVRLTEEGIVFPLKERYNHDAGTLEGIEASTHYRDGQQHGLLPEPPDNGDDVWPMRPHDPQRGIDRSLRPFDPDEGDEQPTRRS